ncbi:MAG: PD-(D/E)XK nuclease family transposase [Eubacteriales bacterium]
MSTSLDTIMQQPVPNTPFSQSNVDYFLSEVEKDPEFKMQWDKLSVEQQSEIIKYYKGEKIPNITSDPIFKHIFNPELHPERLSELISLLLGMEVKVVKALPLENIAYSVYAKDIILDILVQLEDGSYANVEIQRAAFAFSPKRAAVLSANLLSRQYMVLSNQNKKEIDYEDVKNVYTIVLLENTYPYFKDHPTDYVHKSSQTFDTGVNLDLLQHYIFVELGKFDKLITTIDTKLDAWFKFILTKTPYDLMTIIQQFSTFESLYQEIATFMVDRKGIFAMLFEGMAVLDDNSIRNELKRKDNRIAELSMENHQKDILFQQAVQEKQKAVQEKQKAVQEKQKAVQEKQTNMIKGMLANQIPDGSIMQIANVTEEVLKEVKKSMGLL